MAVNVVTNQIYVVFAGESVFVAVIDGATGMFHTLMVGGEPEGVAVNPVTDKIYVANAGTDNISVIDGATYTATTLTSTGAAVAVNPETNKIYVANTGADTVTVIDGVTNSTTSVPVGANPIILAVNSATNEIYVVGDTITVIDGATNATTNIPCTAIADRRKR